MSRLSTSVVTLLGVLNTGWNLFSTERGNLTPLPFLSTASDEIQTAGNLNITHFLICPKKVYFIWLKAYNNLNSLMCISNQEVSLSLKLKTLPCGRLINWISL